MRPESMIFVPRKKMSPKGALKNRNYLRAVTPPLLSILLFGMAIWFLFLPAFKAHLLNDRREMLARMTQLCCEIMSDLETQVQNHQLSREQAQTKAIQQIGSLRYGSQKKDYFWINDMSGLMIMHPHRKDLVGKNILNLVDKNGKHFMRAFIQVVNRSGNGFVEYLWQWQDDPGKIVPKISHVRGFKPWGWIVGTGMYLDDVTLKISGMTRKLNFVFLGILTIIGLLLFHNIRQTLALESERDEAEQSLRNTESRFRKLAENAPFGLTISDNVGRYEYINPRFTQLFGYTIEEVLDKKSWFEKAYPDPDYRQTVMKTWAEDNYELQSKGGNAERVFQVTCKDHARKTIRFRNVPIENQKQFLTYEDITAEEEARQALLESGRKYKLLYKKSKMDEQLYRSLIESSADVIIICDLNGKAQYVSRMFTELFGWSEKEVLFKRIPFVPDSEKNETRRIIDVLVREGVPCRNYETKRLTKKGNCIEVSISASRYIDYKGSPAGILVIIRDIGEKKKLEAQLQQAQKMEAIGTVAGGIAHDFNNLLMGIQGNASLLLMQFEEDHPFHEKLRNIEEQVQSGSKLTSQYKRNGTRNRIGASFSLWNH